MLFFGIDHLIHSHIDGKMMEYIMVNCYWLVISNMKFIFHNIWDNPSQLTFIFFGGIETTNQHDFQHVVNIEKTIAICHGITDTGSIYFWESNVVNPIMMPGTVAYHPKWWYQDSTVYTPRKKYCNCGNKCFFFCCSLFSGCTDLMWTQHCCVYQ